LPRPIFDLSSGSGLKTIAHHADMRQMANQEMKNLSAIHAGLLLLACGSKNTHRGLHHDPASMTVWLLTRRVGDCADGRSGASS
jgi:hypothetical protein